jgi:hypothetical protein
VALKNICLIPHDWTLEIYALHKCSDGSHAHLSASQLRKYESQETVTVIADAGERFPSTIARRNYSYKDGCKLTAYPLLHGQSSRFGEYVVGAIEKKQEWAFAMIADIRGEDMLEQGAAA